MTMARIFLVNTIDLVHNENVLASTSCASAVVLAQSFPAGNTRNIACVVGVRAGLRENLLFIRTYFYVSLYSRREVKRVEGDHCYT